MSFNQEKIRLNYSTDKHNVLKDFYIPALKTAKSYDRAVGFFTSKALLYILQGLDGLMKNEGKMRLVIGKALTDEEYESISDTNSNLYKNLNDKWDEILQEDLAGLEKYRLEVFSWMVKSGFLEIKFAFRRKGLYHKKIGIIRDENNNCIVFDGSINETEAALISNFDNPNGNSERFSVYPSWKSSFNDYGEYEIEEFEDVWNDSERYTKTIELPSDQYKKIEKFYNEDYKPSSGLESERADIFDEFMQNNNEKTTPFDLRVHQKDALRHWKDNGYKGIFALATGAGKTITAIHAIEIISKEISLTTVIAVPYQVLADQWCDVLNLYDISPIKCYRSSARWHRDLIRKVDNFNLGGMLDKMVIVVVNATLRTEKFQEQLHKLRKEKLFFISDECHHHANQLIVNNLPDARFIMGLSATPWSKEDQNSKNILQSYYGDIVARYTLDDALNDGILCKYEYYIHEVFMSEEEEEVYQDLSGQIEKLYARKMNNGLSRQEEDILKYIILKRARQLDSIENKFIKLEEILANKKPSPYKLFYCGSGGSTTEVIDDTEDSNKAIRSIDRITEILYRKEWKVSRFTSLESQSERNSILKTFKQEEIHAIAAIKVLDEGFDIPMCNEAYITASSRNERQFIQRRGRVLRVSPGKDKAIIHDFVITPNSINGPFKKLAENELKRVVEFTRPSINAQDLKGQIKSIIVKYGIDDDFMEKQYAD